MVRFTGTRAGAFRVAFYLMIVLGVTADMRGDSSGSAKAGQRGAAPAATSGDSDEWDRMLTKLGGAPASTAATAVQPAKTSTAAKAAPKKDKAVAAAPRAPKAKPAQEDGWNQALEALGGAPIAPPPQETVRPASPAPSIAAAAAPKAATTEAVEPAGAPAAEAPKPGSAATEVSPAKAAATKPAAKAAAVEPAKPEPKPLATAASGAAIARNPKPVESKAKKPGIGPLKIWLELQAATLSTRYRYIDNSGGVMTNNQLQYNDVFKGRLNFSPKGSYSINAGVASGNNFTGGWNNTGVGTGDPYSNLFLKQLYFEAKPIAGVEAQYGGLAFNRGESTEITSYDNDAYLMGERLSLKRPKNFFFDEISATYAYLGDFNKPGVNKRFYRLKESNYHQFLVGKKLGKRGTVTADYTYAAGVETLRQAIKLNVKGSHALDTVLFENYQRIDFKPDYGFALYGERTMRKRYTLGGGYASIDRNYGGLNADRFNKGKRVYMSSKFVLTPEFSVSTFVTRALSNDYAVSNRTRVDLIFTYDLLKSLQGAGIF